MGRPAPDTNFLPPRSLAKRYFAKRSVFAWELPSLMRKHIYTGAMGSIYFYLTSGLFFVYYGNRIGLTRFQWGLMAGIGSVLLSAQLLSAYVSDHWGHRKAVWFFTALAGRVVRTGGILLSFLLWTLGWPHAGIVLVAAICLSNFLSGLCLPPWMSWLADIIPQDQHGTFMGRRSAWISLGVIATLVPAAVVLDAADDAAKPAVVVVVFAIAGVVGLLDLLIHGTIPEPRMAIANRTSFARRLWAPLADRSFQPWLVFNFSWTLSMALGGTLATLYFVDELQLKNNLLGGVCATSASVMLGAFLVVRWAGRMVDRLGVRRVMTVGHVVWAMLPLCWVFATPETAMVWLTVASLTSGAASRAAMDASTKLITRLPPPEARGMYAAVSTCLSRLAGGLGAFTAGSVLALLGDRTWQFMGRTWVPFHILFVVSFCLRMASVLLIRRLPEPPQQTPPPETP